MHKKIHYFEKNTINVFFDPNRLEMVYCGVNLLSESKSEKQNIFYFNWGLPYKEIFNPTQSTSNIATGSISANFHRILLRIFLSETLVYELYDHAIKA